MKKRTPQQSVEEKMHSQLLQDIAKTKCALDSAYSNFDNVVDPDLIDCYIYEVNAVQKRYKFLLEKATKLQIIPLAYTQNPLDEP